MRVYLSSLILLLAFCSCKKEQPQQVVEIYSDEDFITKVKIVDTACINETQRAHRDIKNNKLVYNRVWLYRRERRDPKTFFDKSCEDYISKELAKVNVKVDTVFPYMTDLRGPDDAFFQRNCYTLIMRDTIEKKLGKHFIDSLITKAEKLYVLRHPNKIHLLQDRDREDDNFYYFLIKKEKDYNKEFKHPTDYKAKNENSYSYTSAYFILMKDGTIKDLDVVASFQNPYNEKFKSYFENEVRKFVMATKWEHPLVGGRIVNSEIDFVFYHK